MSKYQGAGELGIINGKKSCHTPGDNNKSNPNNHKKMTICKNCSNPIGNAKFCSECGQTADVRIPSFFQLVGEALDGMFNFESRLWRTLTPLVFSPGKLTNEYVAGKRAQYVPPFKLYLVLSLLFFLFNSQLLVIFGNENNQTLEVDRSEETIMKRVARCEKYAPFGVDASNKICHSIVSDPQGVASNFQSNLPLVILLGFPIIGLIMKGFYLGSGKLYVEHMIFLLHAHALFFVLGTVLVVLEAVEKLDLYWMFSVLINLLRYLINGYCLYYLFKSLHVVYRQSYWLTSIKFFFLLFSYLFLVLVSLVVAFLYIAYYY